MENICQYSKPLPDKQICFLPEWTTAHHNRPLLANSVANGTVPDEIFEMKFHWCIEHWSMKPKERKMWKIQF